MADWGIGTLRFRKHHSHLVRINRLEDTIWSQETALNKAFLSLERQDSDIWIDRSDDVCLPQISRSNVAKSQRPTEELTWSMQAILSHNSFFWPLLFTGRGVRTRSFENYWTGRNWCVELKHLIYQPMTHVIEWSLGNFRLSYGPMVIQQRLRVERVRCEAEGYLELGMPGHALCALQRHGASVHGDASGCYLMGESLRLLSRYREAIIPLSRSLDLIPDDIRVSMALGWCFKRVGRIHRAIDALEHALKVEPQEAVLHYNLACYWSLVADRQKALRYLAEALAIDGNLRNLVDGESDFDMLRGDPMFQHLIG